MAAAAATRFPGVATVLSGPAVIVLAGNVPGHASSNRGCGAATWATACGTVYKVGRSEEHTSELQSLMRISYAVFCLKKKKINTKRHTSTEYNIKQSISNVLLSIIATQVQTRHFNYHH